MSAASVAQVRRQHLRERAALLLSTDQAAIKLLLTAQARILAQQALVLQPIGLPEDQTVAIRGVA